LSSSSVEAPKIVEVEKTNSLPIINSPVVETKIQRLNRISDEVVANKDLLKPIYSKNSFGGSLGWVAENLNTHNGISLTGYTKTSLVYVGGNPVIRRAKFGCINPELSADSDYFNRYEWDPNHSNRIKWSSDLNDDMRRRCVFGAFFSWRW
jgi:hypothetical protein